MEAQSTAILIRAAHINPMAHFNISTLQVQFVYDLKHEVKAPNNLSISLFIVGLCHSLGLFARFVTRK